MKNVKNFSLGIAMLLTFLSFIVLSSFNSVNNMKIMVTGVVSDQLGPIAGAQVLIQGTKTKTSTDFDGKLSKKSLNNLNPEEIESVVELKEPIYYINGVEYSEESLFGENPTSPYAPLSKQKIDTIIILEPERAIPIYGEKGKKGVVIITIKK